MSEEVEATESAAMAAAPADRGDGRSVTERYAVHASHVFDYCRALVGSDAVAASATRAALVHAGQLAEESHLLRARLMAVARRECLAFLPTGPRWPGAARHEAADGAAAALDQLPAGQREVLALVYRHGIGPEHLPEVLGVPAKDAYQRLASAEQDFVTVATAHELAGSSAPTGTMAGPAEAPAATGPSLEDIGAAPLSAVPGSVWRDARAELAAGSSVPATLPPDRAAGSLARARRRLRLTVATTVPAVAVACWAIVAGVGSAHSVGAHDVGEPSAVSIAPRSSWPTTTPKGAGTSPAEQGTIPVRPGSEPTIPVLALLPSTPAGTVLPITATTGASADPASDASPAASASPSSSPSSAAPSPAASTSSAVPSTSASASSSAATSSAASSPSPSDSASAASPTVPDPSPTS